MERIGNYNHHISHGYVIRDFTMIQLGCLYSTSPPPRGSHSVGRDGAVVVRLVRREDQALLGVGQLAPLMQAEMPPAAEPSMQAEVPPESVLQGSVLQESVLQESVLQEYVLQESMQQEAVLLEAARQESSSARN